MDKNSGFSLIEIICVLIILGVIAAAATIGISRTVQQFNFTRENDAMAQKAQVALNRIVIEFTYLNASAAASELAFSGDSYKYPASYAGVTQTSTFSYNSTTKQLLWNGFILCDNVSAFSLTMTPSGATPSALTSISISMALTGNNNVTQTFNSQVAIKNLSS